MIRGRAFAERPSPVNLYKRALLLRTSFGCFALAHVVDLFGAFDPAVTEGPPDQTFAIHGEEALSVLSQDLLVDREAEAGTSRRL